MVKGIKENQLNKLLVSVHQRSNNFWPGLDQKPVSQKNANKFLLACIIDYQMDADTIWKNAWRLAEEILGDPENIWAVITKVSKEEWNQQFKAYKIHRFPKAHERIWRIGNEIQQRYKGDARNLWQNCNAGEVLKRLHEIQFGDQLSNMVVLALLETGLIAGDGDIKADIHTRRVLGRVFDGKPASVEQAIQYARDIHPTAPWKTDQRLFMIGKTLCKVNQPLCRNCELKRHCRYGLANKI